MHWQKARNSRRIRYAEAVPELLTLSERWTNKDPYLRHALVMGLAGSGKSSELAELATHRSQAVRLSAVLALRRQKSALVSRFLQDRDVQVATAAARAIHDDFSIAGALPALAELLLKTRHRNQALIRRSINANLRLAEDRNIEILQQFINRTEDEAMQLTALASLGFWRKRPLLDPVEGCFRKYPEQEASAALLKTLESLAAKATAISPLRNHSSSWMIDRKCSFLVVRIGKPSDRLKRIW